MSRQQPILTPGHIAPNFEGQAAGGPLRFHQWIGDSWSVVFSHPGNSFAAELSEVARNQSEFEKRKIKVIGFSRNWHDDNRQWNKTQQTFGLYPGSGERTVQIVADDKGKLSSMYGMLSERNSKGIASNPNTVFLVDPMKVIRMVMPYPFSISTKLSQILKFVDENSGPLEDIPVEAFGLDVNGKGRVYNSDIDISASTSATTAAIISSAVQVVNNVRSEAPSGGDGGGGGPAVVTAATDYIQHALNVMDSLADLGKVMPFVAPAFVIIKAIIAVEQRARDVDAKCTDLVQRVTFMLSHLPALKKITVTDATRQVIDRMNDMLKKAAALIQTYRKQSAIARRLSVHNKDRFSSCAQSLKECTNDLMISLQIHQSTQLDILTRPVPSDPEDNAAEKFVAAHGGIEAVKGNEALVKQFASEMKLTVDDNVMEQLNTNIAQVLQQNQDRLEQSLNESVSSSVVEGIRGLAAQMNEASKEQTFTCVQCEKEYHESTNGEKSCSFHRADIDTWSKTYACCGSKNPCEAGQHRSKHHCDYPYGLFFPFTRNITSYADTTERWAEAEDLNLETSETETASIARLLRWKGRGAEPDLPTVLIRVGDPSISHPYFFKTFSTKDLEVVSKVVEITHQTLVFRTSYDGKEFAMVEWVLSSAGVITGVKLTAKAATSTTPFIRVCSFDSTSCTKSGEVLTLSQGGLRASKPSAPYVLPEPQRISGVLHEKPLREVRTDFKTRTTPNLPVVLKSASTPPLYANPQHALSYAQAEYFEGSVSVFNKHAANSSNPISISSVKAFYRLVGEETYRPVESVDILGGAVLPYNIDPRQTWMLKFGVKVPRPEEDLKLDVRWWNRAFLARNRPLRLKLVLTDIEDEECSIVLDYVCPVYKQSGADPDDFAFFYIDNPIIWKRSGVHVAKGPNGTVKIGNQKKDAAWMKTVVWKALKTGESEVALDIGEEYDVGQPTAWSWKSWALVDLSCRRLYAFKILITQNLGGNKGFACLGYVACPEYGDSYDQIRPVLYATEKVKLPDFEPFVKEDVVLDDAFDDFVPEPKQPSVLPTAAPSGSFSSQLVVPEELNQRLASIDNSLSRLATSIEQLVELMQSK